MLFCCLLISSADSLCSTDVNMKKNMRKNTFEGDMEQFILDAINEMPYDTDYDIPSEEEKVTNKSKQQKKPSAFTCFLLLLAAALGIMGFGYYFAVISPHIF